MGRSADSWHPRGMCNEFGLRPDASTTVEAELGAPWKEGAPLTPKISLWPTDDVIAVRQVGGGRVASNYLWGFLPPSAPDRGFIRQWSTFNARDDKLATGRLYGKAFREARCLVPVSLWYETARPPGAKKGLRCTIQPTTEKIFVFAGLWSPWKDPANGQHHDTVVIVTTEPNATIAELPHPRMPAVLPKDAWGAWLDPATSVPDLQAMLQPAPDEWMEAIAGRPKH